MVVEPVEVRKGALEGEQPSSRGPPEGFGARRKLLERVDMFDVSAQIVYRISL